MITTRNELFERRINTATVHTGAVTIMTSITTSTSRVATSPKQLRRHPDVTLSNVTIVHTGHSLSVHISCSTEQPPYIAPAVCWQAKHRLTLTKCSRNISKQYCDILQLSTCSLYGLYYTNNFLNYSTPSQYVTLYTTNVSSKMQTTQSCGRFTAYYTDACHITLIWLPPTTLSQESRWPLKGCPRGILSMGKCPEKSLKIWRKKQLHKICYEGTLG